MLRTDTLALPAVYTFRCFPRQTGRFPVIRNSLCHLPIAKLFIHDREDLWDRDLFRAAFRTVVTGGAGNGR